MQFAEDRGSEASGPLAEIIDEARRVLAAVAERDLPVRLLGGVAVFLHSEGLPEALRRPYKDIDLATVKGNRRPVSELLMSLGYEAAEPFNSLNGHRRLLFYDTRNDRQVDVFVGTFEMCHAIPITDRITLERETIPPAELLMTKLQVIEMNEKDLRDVVALLHCHEVADHDRDVINARIVARLTASDWGLWRTIKLNLELLREGLHHYGLTDADKEAIVTRADKLWASIEAEPKSSRWKMRSRVGDRKRWYEQPEEVD